ncbi:MAG: hypothetical protein PHR30_07325 [Gallionellaceae bacterium]|nr:hypothetical protein [Gallionellaceae bacterium]MDD5365135.1 hypothetical protein [Gallionellaceae bacterium]
MTARYSLLLVAGLSFGQAAQADLTLIGRSTLTTLNMPNQGREALYVKKNQMRRDLTDRGRSYSYLYDLKKKEVAFVDHSLRQVEIHALSNDKAGKNKDMRLELTPTGRKHDLDDWNCLEYTLAASLPAEMGQEQVTVLLDGQVWLERKVSERKEVLPFIKSVEADDFFVGAVTPGQPINAQAQGINEVMRRVLGKGMLCAADIQLNYEGSGPMADLGRRMATKAGIVYETQSDAPLDDALFEIPAGYREVRR